MNSDTIHNMQEDLREALQPLMRLGERLGADLSSPASCSETSEARTEHDAHNKITTPLRHSETEGWGGMQRLIDCLEEQAEDDDYNALDMDEGCPKAAKNLRSNAAEKRQWITMLSALRMEPLTESEAGGVEECPKCAGRCWCTIPDPFAFKCSDCGNIWTRGKRRERSESRNALADAPRTTQ